MAWKRELEALEIRINYTTLTTLSECPNYPFQNSCHLHPSENHSSVLDVPIFCLWSTACVVSRWHLRDAYGCTFDSTECIIFGVGCIIFYSVIHRVESSVNLLFFIIFVVSKIPSSSLTQKLFGRMAISHSGRFRYIGGNDSQNPFFNVFSTWDIYPHHCKVF